MIIHEPEFIEKDGLLTVSARVEAQAHLEHLPASLWFRFPEEQRGYISERSDGFVASLILMAMYFGEPLEVRGPVSARLAAHLDEFQDAYVRMLGNFFKMVDVRFDQLVTPAASAPPPGVGAAFSGGIDSTFTLWSHTGARESDPAARLTHGIFIHGYDILLHRDDFYNRLYDKYRLIFARQNLDLLRVQTNVYLFSQFRLDWVHVHEPPLAGVALMYGKLLRRFYKPGGAELHHGEPILPSAYLPLLSTETLEVLLDGANLTRFSKLPSLIDFEPAQEGLRVCANITPNPDGTACYKCEKCLSAALYLEMTGGAGKFKTFPRPISPGLFLRMGWTSLGLWHYYHRFLPRELLKRRMVTYYLLYMLMSFPSEAKRWTKGLLARLLPEDVKQRLKRRLLTDHVVPGDAAEAGD